MASRSRCNSYPEEYGHSLELSEEKVKSRSHGHKRHRSKGRQLVFDRIPGNLRQIPATNVDGVYQQDIFSLPPGNEGHLQGSDWNERQRGIERPKAATATWPRNTRMVCGYEEQPREHFEKSESHQLHSKKSFRKITAEEARSPLLPIERCYSEKEYDLHQYEVDVRKKQKEDQALGISKQNKALLEQLEKLEGDLRATNKEKQSIEKQKLQELEVAMQAAEQHKQQVLLAAMQAAENQKQQELQAINAKHQEEMQKFEEEKLCELMKAAHQWQQQLDKLLEMGPPPVISRPLQSKKWEDSLSLVSEAASATVYECSAAGTTIFMDDVEVTIPPMAVPQGKTIHVEMGVATYGPFTFASNCEPVSPILWFCTQEKIEFELPVTFKLPHVLINTTGVALSFAKADHSTDKRIIPFEKMNKVKCKFGAHHGTLFSKHPCYLCIQVETTNKDSLMHLSSKKGYCLHIITKKQNSLTYEIIIACTYFLITCIKAVKAMFPEKDYSHKIKENFQFRDTENPCLEISYSSNKDLEFTAEKGSKIFATKVDFWKKHDYDYMAMMHDEKMYPPSISILVHSETSQWATIILNVKGAKIENMEEHEEVSFKTAKQFGSHANTIPQIDMDQKTLQMESHFNTVYTTLSKSVAQQWEDFSSYLEVSPSTVERIGRENSGNVRACFREMIKQWLKQRSPPPTRSKILEALRELDFHEEANKLELKL